MLSNTEISEICRERYLDSLSKEERLEYFKRIHGEDKKEIKEYHREYEE